MAWTSLLRGIAPQAAIDREGQVIVRSRLASGAFGWKKISTDQCHAEQMGAVSDGVADDGPAIQAAHDSLAAAGGGDLLLGHNHRIATQVVISGNNVRVLGHGMAGLNGTQVYIDGPGTSFTPFKFLNCQFGMIRDVYFRASKIYTGECYAVEVNGGLQNSIERVRVETHWGHTRVIDAHETFIIRPWCSGLYGNVGILFIGTAGKGGYECTITDAHMTSPLSQPVPDASSNGPWQSSHGYSLGNMVTNGGLLWQCVDDGISASSGGPLALPSVSTPSELFTSAGDVTDGTCKWRFVSTTGYAHVMQDSYAYTLRMARPVFVNGMYPFIMRDVVAAGGRASEPHFCFVTELETDHCYESALIYRGSEMHFIGGNIGTTNYGNALTFDAGAAPIDASVIGMKVYAAARHGIYVGCNNVKIGDCAIGQNGQAAANTYDGIQVESNASKFSITGNKSLQTTGSQRRGLTINNGTSDNYVVADNDFTGNATAGMYDGGSGASKVVHGNLPDPLRISLGGQTANIGATNIFPVNPGAGLYEVDVLLEVLGDAGASGTLICTIAWTDGLGATSEATAGINITANGRARSKVLVQTAGSANVTYATSGITTPASFAYTLRIVTRGPLAQ